MNKKQQQLFRRKMRVRAKIYGTKSRPRLCVVRTLKHVHALLIDDTKGHTIAAVSDLKKARDVKDKKTKTMIAQEIGESIAEAAKKIGIVKVVFDRAGRRYHGRVKAVAEAARKGGLSF